MVIPVDDNNYTYPNINNNILNRYLTMIVDHQRGNTEVTNIIFVLLDGVGYELFDNTVDFISKDRLEKISSIYPTTTASIITSLAVGKPPGKHGVLEWNLYIPEIDMLIQPLLFRPLGSKISNILCSNGIDPNNVVRYRGFLRKIGKDVNIRLFLRGFISGSCYSRHIFRGLNIMSYINVTDLSISIKKCLVNDRDRRNLYYVYIEGIDSISHKYGYNSEESKYDLRLSIKILLEELKKLDKSIKRETCLILTSDHGCVTVNHENMFYLDKEVNSIKKYVKRDLRNIPLIAGSPRNVYVHCKEGYRDKLFRILDEKLSSIGIVLYRDELVKSDIMWEVDKKYIGRLGDIIILPRGDYGVWFKHKNVTYNLLGYHGGISRLEMDIPYFEDRLDKI
jgi:hypothetical protein